MYRWYDSEIDTKEPELPATFLEAECNDRDKAMARFLKTLQWRKDNDVDIILHVRATTYLPTIPLPPLLDSPMPYST